MQNIFVNPQIKKKGPMRGKDIFVSLFRKSDLCTGETQRQLQNHTLVLREGYFNCNLMYSTDNNTIP